MSTVRFRARNHPQQTAKRGESLFPDLDDPTDEVDDRWTPPELWDELNERFAFTVDVASSDANAKCERHYTLETDGLVQSWDGERVWCNPPFSEIRPWVEKAHASDALVVMLVPANRTEQGWWQEYVEPHRDHGGRLTVEFIAGRTKFVLPRGEYAEKGNTPPFGCCLLIWSPGGTS